MAAAPSTGTAAAQPPRSAQAAALAINNDAWRTKREFIYIDRLGAAPRQYINNEINPAICNNANPRIAVLCKPHVLPVGGLRAASEWKFFPLPTITLLHQETISACFV
ncbi:hypothetical protein [Paraburkholderia bryophila]|uniref:Uncharacterized protein n=1 Tax=Paraburkholderia bryophila TaxID=420952 RepID=A0A7Z0B291_9BURK|nr:hypothetical protein [Paraburkholderia bryophila]NYH17212.1 hypothetical protein [Paraburkholderia bryophila]